MTEQEKIEAAIHKAVVAANQGDGEVSKKVSDKVVSLLNSRFKKGETMSKRSGEWRPIPVR